MQGTCVSAAHTHTRISDAAIFLLCPITVSADSYRGYAYLIHVSFLFPSHTEGQLPMYLRQSLINSKEQNISWEADRRSATQEITPFYGIRKLITVLTRDRHWNLPWTKRVQSTSSHSIPL